jgi:branched-subunit amino acid transport protein
MTTSYGPTAVWGVILAIGLITYAIRLSFIALFGRIDDIPPGVERALAYVPAAVLAALVVPELVTVQSTLVATLGQDRLLAGLVAAAVAWRTENVFATIAVGMGALWLLRFVVPLA